MNEGRRLAPAAGPYWEAVCKVRVRFQETDALGVVWHGHYLLYFEDGRGAFGRAFGLDYLDMHAEGFVAPIVRVEIDYVAPCRFGDEIVVRTRLHLEDGARLRFSYRIENALGVGLVSGSTVQVFLDAERRLVLTPPAFLRAWRDRERARLVNG